VVEIVPENSIPRDTTTAIGAVPENFRRFSRVANFEATCCFGFLISIGAHYSTASSERVNTLFPSGEKTF